MISVRFKAIMAMAMVMRCYEQVVLLPEGARLRDLLDVLEEKYGPPLIEILCRDECGRANPRIIFFLNSKNVLSLDGFNTLLNDGDEVFPLPPVGGG